MFPIRLRRDIIALLAVKATLLAALYVLFFSSPHRIDPTPERLRAHLLSDTNF